MAKKSNTCWVVVINGDVNFESTLPNHLEEDILQSPVSFRFGGETKHGFVSRLGYMRIIPWARRMHEEYICSRIQIFEMHQGRRRHDTRFSLKFSSLHPPTPARRTGTYMDWISFLGRHELHLTR